MAEANVNKDAPVPYQETSVQRWPEGRIALWRAEEARKALFTGKISIPPPLLAELLLRPETNGDFNLDVIGFRSESQHARAPSYSGYVLLSEPRELEAEAESREPVQKGRIALWKTKNAVKAVFTGRITLPSEVLLLLQEQPKDEEGNKTLDTTLYVNTSENVDAPLYTGLVQPTARVLKPKPGQEF